MPIYREKDFLGRVFHKTKPPSGSLEILIGKVKISSFPKLPDIGDPYLAIRVEQPNSLTYLPGHYQFGAEVDEWDVVGEERELIKEEINEVDMASRRSWLGFRTRYSWDSRDGDFSANDIPHAFREVLKQLKVK